MERKGTRHTRRQTKLFVGWSWANLLQLKYAQTLRNDRRPNFVQVNPTIVKPKESRFGEGVLVLVVSSNKVSKAGFNRGVSPLFVS